MHVQRDSPSNAIAVLISALPTEMAASIEAQATAFYSSVLHEVDNLTQTSTAAATAASHTTTFHTTATPSITQHTATSAAADTTRATTSASSHTSSSTLAAAAAAPTTTSHHLLGGAIAGIVVGVVAGIALLFLLAWFLLRRRRQGKPLFGHGYSRTGGGVYPEVAWLYDPKPSPHNSVRDRPNIRHNVGGNVKYPQHQHQRSVDGLLTNAPMQQTSSIRQVQQRPPRPETRFAPFFSPASPPSASSISGRHPSVRLPAQSYNQADSATRPLIPPLVVTPPITDAVPEIISRGASIDQRTSWDEPVPGPSHASTAYNERPWQVSPIRVEQDSGPYNGGYYSTVTTRTGLRR